MSHKRNFLARLGKKFLDFLAVIGRLAMFTITSVKCIFGRPFYFKQLIRQCVSIGYYSLPVVASRPIRIRITTIHVTNSGKPRAQV